MNTLLDSVREALIATEKLLNREREGRDRVRGVPDCVRGALNRDSEDSDRDLEDLVCDPDESERDREELDRDQEDADRDPKALDRDREELDRDREDSDRDPEVFDRDSEVLDRDRKDLYRARELRDRDPEVLDRDPEVFDRDPEVLDRDRKDLYRARELRDRDPKVLDRDPEVFERDSEVLDRDRKDLYRARELLDRDPEVLDRDFEEVLGEFAGLWLLGSGDESPHSKTGSARDFGCWVVCNKKLRWCYIRVNGRWKHMKLNELNVTNLYIPLGRAKISQIWIVRRFVSTVEHVNVVADNSVNFDRKEKLVMARQRRKSDVLEIARQRLAGLKEITPKPDFGPGLSVEAFEAEVNAFREFHDSYNGDLAALDDKTNELDDRELRLNDFSLRILAAVKGLFGPDSSEFEQVGGTRRRDRKRRVRAAKPETKN